MKLTILGYWGGYPSAGGATAGYLLSLSGQNLLLDCGSGVMSRLPFYSPIEQVKHVILSHLHYDHMADIGIFQYAVTGALRNKRTDDKVTIFSPSDPVGIRSILPHESSSLVEIEEGRVYDVGDAKIEFFPVQHTIPAYAVKIVSEGKTLVYSADTVSFPELVPFVEGADLFICESTIAKGSVHTTGKGHMDARAAGLIAQQAGAKKLLLTHLPHDGDFLAMKQEAAEVFDHEVIMATEVAWLHV